MNNSLRFRLALIYIGLAIGPLIIAGVIIAVNSFNTLEQQSLVLQRKVAESVEIEIRGIIEHWENELVLLDEVYGVGALELKEQRAILSNTLMHQRAFQEVALLNSEGQEQIRLSRTSVILDSDLQSRAGNEEFLFPATSSGTYLGPVRFDDTIREPLATISVPGLDGVETLRELWRIGQNVPVYITTAFYDDFRDQLQSTIDDGISFDLLKKPVDRDTIRSIVRVV